MSGMMKDKADEFTEHTHTPSIKPNINNSDSLYKILFSHRCKVNPIYWEEVYIQLCGNSSSPSQRYYFQDLFVGPGRC